jgi:hypothetical protein
MRAEQATAVPSTIANVNATEGNRIVPEVEYYTCEHCGEEVKLRGKGFHVGRHCRALHPKKVVEPAIEPSQEG